MRTHMTIDEVFAVYPEEWVLLDELESHDNLTVQSGRVVGHSPDRSDVETMAIEKGLERCVIVCTRSGIPRSYAVSTITSAEEIKSVVSQKQ